MVRVSSTRFWRLDDEDVEDVFMADFFQEAIWAFWPEAVLKRCSDSLKEGPDSMEDSMRLLSEEVLAGGLDLEEE